MSNTTYTVSPSIRQATEKSVQRKMIDVVIALLPAVAVGVYYLKLEALWIILASVISCVLSEFAWQKLTHQTVTISDFSAVVTGLLLGLNLPYNVPVWVPVIGGIFAIVVVKQFFGGRGHNFMNPTLAARAFLLAAWTGVMSQTAGDATASASQTAPTIMELIKGPMGMYIGEVSVGALLIGGIYLLIRRIISFRIPVAYIGTAFVLSWLLGTEGLMTGDPVTGILSGALMLGAFFMATDPSSASSTKLGQYIMGIGCGILTVIFRVYGHNQEGFVYAILIMNLFVPLIDKYTVPKKLKGVA